MATRGKARRVSGPALNVSVTPELAELAMREGWNGGEMFATAMQLSLPDAEDIEIRVAANPDAKPALRGGYLARPVPDWRKLDRAALGCGSAGT
jgi:hypothetical protein